jgi:glutathione S-transferase
MQLIGMYDSPFVRRVAITLHHFGLPFQHSDWSVGRDFELIRQINPLVRVPTLVLDDGSVLCESASILDYLDEWAGAARALLPGSGVERRDALQLIALAIGAAEKAREQVYEVAFRPPQKRHEPWLERCRAQMHGGLSLLELRCQRCAEQPWLLGERLSQADISVACAVSFMSDALQLSVLPSRYPRLAARVARYEALPAFRATRAAFLAPAS